jgi:hypothetical protein
MLLKGGHQRKVKGAGRWPMKSLGPCLSMFFIVDLAAIKKTIIPFPLTPANLLGTDQTISNGAANQIAPMYWCC